MTRRADEIYGPPSFSLIDSVFGTRERTATTTVHCEGNVVAVGAEVPLQIDCSAMLRAMPSPSVGKSLRGAATKSNLRRIA